MDYKTKKIKNQELQQKIKNKISEKMFQRLVDCGNFLEFYADEKKEIKKLVKANNCENRFCPMCAYKKARKEALKISILLKVLENKYKFLFLTLTAPNVSGSTLNIEIKHFNESFKRMTKLKPFENAVIGYIRKLEVTYNHDLKNYHPHFHVLLAVKKSYFSNNYISQAKWLEMWRSAKRDNSITQVDIRKLDLSKDDKGILEIAKYSAKDSDYLKSQKIFDVIYSALKGKKLVTYNGIFKEIVKEYKRGKLDYLNEIDMTEYVYRILYQWGQGDYVEREIRELTEDERIRFNKQQIDDMNIDRLKELKLQGYKLISSMGI